MTKSLFLELLGGIFGWIGIGAAIGSVYFLYGALADGAPWLNLIWSTGAGFAAKYLAVALDRNKQRVDYVGQLMERGYTRAEATEAWRIASDGGLNLLLNVQQAETIAETDWPDIQRNCMNVEKSNISHGR